MSFACPDCAGCRTDEEGNPCLACSVGGRSRGRIYDDAEDAWLGEAEGDERDAALSGLDPEHPVNTGF